MKTEPKTKLKDIYEDTKWEIEWNYDSYIMGPIRNFIYGIKNLWTWKSIIWNDRWYDHTYFQIMLRKKLETIALGYDGAHYVNSEKDQAEVIKLIQLLDDAEAIDNDMLPGLSGKYQEFGERLFSIREFVRKGHKDETFVVRTTFFEMLWD